MKISMNERYLLFAQIGMILQAGYGIEQGLHLIADQLEDKKVKQLVLLLNEKRLETSTLSEAFAASEAFDQYTVELIRAGEVSGNVDEVMLSLAAYNQRMAAMTENLKQALSYPILLVVMMFAVVGVVVWKVLPIFQNVLRSLGSDLSSHAASFMNYGRIFSIVAFVFLGICILALLGFLFYARVQKKDAATLFVNTCFFTRKLRNAAYMAQLTYALSLFLSSGIDLQEAMHNARNLFPDGELRQKMDACSKDMEQGISFPETIARHKLYQGMQMNMIQIGFASGRSDEVMKQMSHYYQEEVEKKTEHFLNVIEPSVVLLLAFIIGIVLLSIMLPLMSILSSL